MLPASAPKPAKHAQPIMLAMRRRHHRLRQQGRDKKMAPTKSEQVGKGDVGEAVSSRRLNIAS